MQVSVETTEGLERKMTVQVPAGQIDAQVDERLKSMARTLRVDGFRPGKAPLKVIKRQYGGRVRGEVVDEVIHSTFGEAVNEQSLHLAGPPSITAADLNDDELKYTATFEVYPEVTLVAMSEISVERPVAEVAEADVDAMLEKLREQRATWKTVERAAAEGDRVTIDFEGSIDGELFQGGKAEKAPIVLGSKQMIPGFEEQLVGLSAGDEKTLEVSFPEAYHVESLAGKAARFAVKLHSVEEKELPELNDELAAEMKVAEGGLEGLRKEVRGNMERELRGAIQSKVKSAVMDALLEKNPFDLPKALVEREIDVLSQDAQRYNQGGNFSLPRELFEEQARRRVALGLMVGEIVRSGEMKADTDRVRAKVEELASTYEEPAEVIAWYYKNPEYLSRIQSSVLEDQVVEQILSEARVNDVTATFDEVMNAGK
ncbi:trigger factor [Endothiovibrio diazotrophicus]